MGRCFNPLAGIRCFLTMVLGPVLQILYPFQSPSGDSLFSDS